MANWDYYRSLEASLCDFLTSQLASYTDIAGNSLTIKVAEKDERNPDWSLPLVTLYFDNENSTTPFISSFKRDDLQVIIIDIYALTKPDRLDIAKLIVDTINDGWVYYDYADNPSDPDNPTKVENRRINIQNFLENTRVDLGQNVDAYDQHRHRISINVWKSGS
ncbi:MAG: hypothetical protein PVG65_01035 [Candidatus Thorarchaeota archaeon]|jgi:hypothetical protein